MAEQDEMTGQQDQGNQGAGTAAGGGDPGVGAGDPGVGGGDPGATEVSKALRIPCSAIADLTSSSAFSRPSPAR